MRNYGKQARVLQISPEVVPIADRIVSIDFHRDCLLIITNNSVLGWNLHRGDWTQGIITDST